MNSFVPTHLHTHFSNLDGLSTSEEYCARAVELGVTALAITDHGTMSGHREHQRACKSAGIKPILGVEAYLSATDRFDKRSNAKRQDGTSAYNHVTLLASNQTGLNNLYALGDESWTSGFYNKPRCDRELLQEYSEGVIVLSGCLNGVIAKAIEREDEEDALRWAKWFKNVYGERFFIEVQGHNPQHINLALLSIADKLGIKPAMASDCHYSNPEDLWAEEAMLILSTNPKQNRDINRDDMEAMSLLEKMDYLYPDRQMTFKDLQLYLRTYEEEQNLFAAQGIDRTDIFTNTHLIADMTQQYDYLTGVDVLPHPKYDPDERLIELAYSGLRKRNIDTPEYRSRIETELRTVITLDQSRYFLLLADMISYAKNKKQIRVGPGRGSGGGSLLGYSLGITEVDPIKHNLLFSRFLHAGDGVYDIAERYSTTQAIS